MRWSWIERGSGWAVEAVDREGRWLRLRVAAEIKELVGAIWLGGEDSEVGGCWIERDPGEGSGGDR